MAVVAQLTEVLFKICFCFTFTYRETIIFCRACNSDW